MNGFRADGGEVDEQGAGRWSVPAGVALLILVAVADAVLGPTAVLIGGLSFGPLVASLGATRRQTAAIAVAAAVPAVLLGQVDAIFGSLDHGIRVGVVSLAGVIAVHAAEQRQRREEVARQLLEVVEIAQTVMLRPPPSRIAHVGMAAHYVSASDVARVGGDLYETAFTPTGVRMVIGDVRGKGLEAVALAATVLAAFRESLWETDLVTVARHLDERVTLAAADEEFVTALIVEIPADGSMSIINLGHHAPLRMAASRTEELVPSTISLPLGLGPVPQVDRFEFLVGDRLLLFTDGLVEARDQQGRFFPLADVTEVLRAPDLQDAVRDLMGALLQHVPGRLADDMALLLAERLPVGVDTEYSHA